MITIILITMTFVLINGIPYVRIWLGRWPWEQVKNRSAIPKRYHRQSARYWRSGNESRISRHVTIPSAAAGCL